MASSFTVEEKRAIVIGSLFPMLKNDLHRVVDCTCAEHGKPGSGPNFTAAMLCLIASEVVGRLSSDPCLDDDAATVDFLRRVADQSGDNRYQLAAKALIVYFRHGIAHSFMPKQPSTVKASVDWAQREGDESGICVDFLNMPIGAAALSELRSHHLEVRQAQGERVFAVVPQVLYVDVLRVINAFEQAVRASDHPTLTRLEGGFEKWWGRASSIKGRLDDTGRTYLGIS